MKTKKAAARKSTKRPASKESGAVTRTVASTAKKAKPQSAPTASGPPLSHLEARQSVSGDAIVERHMAILEEAAEGSSAGGLALVGQVLSDLYVALARNEVDPRGASKVSRAAGKLLRELARRLKEDAKANEARKQ